MFPTTIETIEVQEPQMVVRSCLNGIDEQGTIKKTLYCTRDGRFFMRYTDGWHKRKPCDNHKRRKEAGKLVGHPSKGGGYDCPFISRCNNSSCHRLVAYAWCEHPACAKTDPLWYKHYEADHINGDHGNWTADNLRWVTPKENYAWRSRSIKLKKLALNLKWIRPDLLVAISDLKQEHFERFMTLLPEVMKADERPMSYLTLTDDISKALCKTMVVEPDDDDLVECSRCGARIPYGAAISTHYGYLCDICYSDLYD